MKIKALSALAAASLALTMTACGGETAPSASTTPTTTTQAPSATPTPTPTPTPTTAGTLTKEGDKLVDSDPKADVIEGAGFAITVDPAAKTARFTQIDPASGAEFQNFSEFNYADNTFVRQNVVAAMGKTYVYTIDLATNTMTKVTDGDGADLSESMRSSGRWDKGQADTVAQAKAIADYFEARYGMSVEKAVQNA